MLKKIAVVLFLVGVAGVVGPWFGFVLRGATEEVSRIGGFCVMGLGVVIGVIGIGVAGLEKKSAARAKEARMAKRAAREAGKGGEG